MWNSKSLGKLGGHIKRHVLCHLLAAQVDEVARPVDFEHGQIALRDGPTGQWIYLDMHNGPIDGTPLISGRRQYR